MHSLFALLDVRSLFEARNAVVPVAGGMFAGLAVALFRTPTADSDAESLMNFSSLGTLRCICGTEHPTGLVKDRRQFCRSCGCEVVAQDPAKLDRKLTRKEITAMTRSLKQAVVRASHLELPPSITNIEELHAYLESTEPKTPRTPPTQSTPVEQTQTH